MHLYFTKLPSRNNDLASKLSKSNAYPEINFISRNLKAVGALLGHYLRHASTRTESLMTELTTEELLGPPPDIAPKSDVESETVAPNFSKVKVDLSLKPFGSIRLSLFRWQIFSKSLDQWPYFPLEIDFLLPVL